MVYYKCVLGVTIVLITLIINLCLYATIYNSEFRRIRFRSVPQYATNARNEVRNTKVNLRRNYTNGFIPDAHQLFGPMMDDDRRSFIPQPPNTTFHWNSINIGLKKTVEIHSWEQHYSKMNPAYSKNSMKKLPKVFVAGEYSLFDNACFINGARLTLLWPVKDQTQNFTYSDSQSRFAESDTYMRRRLPIFDLDVVDSEGIFDYSTRSIHEQWLRNSTPLIHLPGTIHHWLLPYDTANCWHGFHDHIFPQFKTLVYLMKNSASSHIFPFDAWFLAEAKTSPNNYLDGDGACFRYLAIILRGFLTFYNNDLSSTKWMEIPFPALYFERNTSVGRNQIFCFDRLVYRGSNHNTTEEFHSQPASLMAILRQRMFEFLQYSSHPLFPQRDKRLPVTRYLRERPLRIVIHDRSDSARRQWVNADDLIKSIDPHLLADGTIHLRYLRSMGSSLSAWEQIGVHLTCDLLISVHGANLMLTLFMPKNSSVVQVGPSHFVYPFMGSSTDNRSIAFSYSLNQYAVTGITIYPSPNGANNYHSLNLIVSPRLILQEIRSKLGIDIERKWDQL